MLRWLVAVNIHFWGCPGVVLMVLMAATGVVYMVFVDGCSYWVGVVSGGVDSCC